MNDKMVTIIIPVYNVESELDRCMQSVIKQTYDNIEIILVDDGSPDKCPQMCDEYAKKDYRIKVIHKKNGGLSDARNAGLDTASGDYIAFIDSDDWVSDDFIEVLVANIERTNSDISICNFNLVNELGKTCEHPTFSSQIKVLNNSDSLRELFSHYKYDCMVCTKLFRKKLFENVRFPKGKLFEDVAVSLPLFAHSRRCVISNKANYFYSQRNESIVNSSFSENKMDLLLYSKKMIKFSHEHGHKYDIEAESFYLKCLLRLLMQAYQNVEDKRTKEMVYYMHTEIKKHRRYIWGNKFIEKRRQILLYAIVLHIPSKVLVRLWNVRMSKKYE